MRRLIQFLGRKLISWSSTTHRLIAFALITLGVAITKFNFASKLIRPALRLQVYKYGLRLLPMTTFFSLALGFLIIGQTVFILNRVGARDMVGTVMVTVVVRELGPLITALLVLMRCGTASVVELGTARALGEVEAMEALAIDPIHYLVLPRVIAMALSIFALSLYLIVGTVLSGYLFIFLQEIPLLPGEYIQQIAVSLNWIDFVVLGVKTIAFGAVSSIISSYHGLARPVRLEEVSAATVRALGQSVTACVIIDVLFIFVYLVI